MRHGKPAGMPGRVFPHVASCVHTAAVEYFTMLLCDAEKSDRADMSPVLPAVRLVREAILAAFGS